MKKFLTQFHERKRFFTNPGNPIKVKYGASYDEAGRVQLVEEGTENLYDFIQSFADSCDIHVLLKRYSNGEVDVLSKVQGMYGDFTEFPTTYAELLNTVNRGEAMFNEFPVDVRAKFNHNFAEFMASLSDGSFFDRAGIKQQAEPESTPVEEVTE